MQIQNLLIEKFTHAVRLLGVDDCSIPVSKSTKSGFGDYQFNGAMALAKQLKKNPREIAQLILDNVQVDELVDKLEIAGPGFINIYLSQQWLGKSVEKINASPTLGISAQKSQKIVVDYSSPNLAKEMHVGHLRSTIIGDACVRVLEFLGHDVVRQNHMGDWGTQFGMLLAHLADSLAQKQVASTALEDLEDFYRQAKVRFDEETGFADRARDYVVKLQSGDEQCLALWQQFIDVSVSHSEEVYQKLGVTLTREHIMGESAYNPDLPVLVDDLMLREIAVEDQGAKVVFLPELADKEGNPAVYIIQKSGGGFLYSTTDLAAIRYRFATLGAHRCLIFTDARQAHHFKQTEIVARKAGYLDINQQYQHCPFGMMLGKDGKPFKTRTGGTIKLSDLLTEAKERASKLLEGRSLDHDTLQSVANSVGIGAVKYADLSKNRTTDYIFDWDTMLAFEGNTAPYLQYAYTRIQSIFRKAGIDINDVHSSIQLSNVSEKNLAVKLLQFEEVLTVVGREATPHVLCTYLYELASLFMKFYEDSPILKHSVDEATKNSRLAIAKASANTLRLGLEMLGIDTLERM